MKKSIKRVVVSLMAMFILFTTVAFGTGVIVWGGTDNFNTSMDNLVSIIEKTTELKGEKQALELKITKLKKDKGALELEILAKSGTINSIGEKLDGL